MSIMWQIHVKRLLNVIWSDYDAAVMTPQTRTVTCLGLAQTLAWASSYYLPAMLASSMARDLGVSSPMIFAAFSAALVVSALLGPLAGRAIDRFGGRRVLMLNSLVFALGLVCLALAQGPVGLFAGWCIMGMAMAAGLYEAAFATLVHLYGQRSRGPITGITLMAGLASTIGWPLSAWLELHWGWRTACMSWAGLHLLLGLPLNALLQITPDPSANQDIQPVDDSTSALAPAAEALSQSSARRAGALLALVFAITWFISTAMAAHLPRLLQAQGLPLATGLERSQAQGFAGARGDGPGSSIKAMKQTPPSAAENHSAPPPKPSIARPNK